MLGQTPRGGERTRRGRENVRSPGRLRAWPGTPCRRARWAWTPAPIYLPWRRRPATRNTDNIQRKRKEARRRQPEGEQSRNTTLQRLLLPAGAGSSLRNRSPPGRSARRMHAHNYSHTKAKPTEGGRRKAAEEERRRRSEGVQEALRTRSGDGDLAQQHVARTRHRPPNPRSSCNKPALVTLAAVRPAYGRRLQCFQYPVSRCR